MVPAGTAVGVKALLVGCWDGVNAWLQWDGSPTGGRYQVEVRLRRPAKGGATPDWEPWQRTGGLEPISRPWLVIRTHREGSALQARVATFGAEDWKVAAEAEFLRSRCTFEIATANRRVHYLPGTVFHGVVDGAPASYQTQAEIELQPGETGQVAMQAVDPSGYHQLDGPGHFLIHPALGLTIRNIAASEDDLKETGRDFTELTRLERATPFYVAFGAVNHFDGSTAVQPK